ncbi:MAG: DivIVA domain-containing protein, partial [Clostridia bacterium]|nr:DivIVA domain-containing protein [Clostridia bacterium]
MALTPLDIEKREFRRALRGYDAAEVDAFLDEVVREFEAQLRENRQLRDQIEELKEKLSQYQQLDDTLRSTLLVAQETAEEVKASARKEAELIVREAQEEARRRVELAEARVRELREDLKRLHREVEAFRARVRSLL